MTTLEVLKIAVYFLLILATTKPLGLYMKRVFSKEKTFLDPLLRPVERLVYRVSGVDETKEHDWMQYTIAMLLFSAVGLLLTYLIERIQHLLPLNPDKMGAGRSRSGVEHRRLVHDEHELAGLQRRVDDVALHADGGADVPQLRLRGRRHRPGHRPHSRHRPRQREDDRQFLGRSDPLHAVGAPPDLPRRGDAPPVAGRDPEFPSDRRGDDGRREGPEDPAGAGGLAGSDQGARHQRRRLLQRQLGPPIREPDALHATCSRCSSSSAIGAGLLHARIDDRQAPPRLGGLLGHVDPLPRRCVHRDYSAEQRGNPMHQRLGVAAADGNMEGKEVRFGIGDSALFATITTDASCGAVNAMHDSFTPIGGSIPLLNIMLGEVIFGGVGAGLYGMIPLHRAVGVHRRTDGRANAGIPRQEDRSARREAGHAGRAHSGVLHSRRNGRRGGDHGRHIESQQRRTARPQRDDVCVHERHRQQRQRLRRPQRQHEVLQHRPRRCRCSSAAS